MGLFPKDFELLAPYDDRIFKAMLISPQAKPALMFVSSAVIKRPVVDVVVRSTELPVETNEEKNERFDVNCLINDNTQADIEMQSDPMEEVKGSKHENLRARCLYNLCDLHSSQPSVGKSYDKLSKTYQVMFCGYSVWPERKGFIHSFSMRHDEDNGLLHDGIRSMIIELTKLQKILKKPIEQMTDMECISIFLRYADKPKYRELVNKVIESREGLAVAGEVLMGISKDERERAIFRNRRIAKADQESNRITAVRNAEKAQALAVAKIMLADGEPVEKIIKYFGLTRAEVEALRDAN